MSREDVESDGTLSPLAKLVVEWLSRREDRIHTSTEVGVALGVYGAVVAEEAHSLRRKGLILRMDGGKALPLSQLRLSKPTRDIYVARKKTA